MAQPLVIIPVRLTQHEYAALVDVKARRQKGGERGTSFAEIIREALDQWLEKEKGK